MTLTKQQIESIKQASHQVLEQATQFLQSIVKVDTTNPPGLNYRQIATLIQSHLDPLGYETHLLPVDEHDLDALAPHDPHHHERVNLIARLPSSSSTKTLVTTKNGTKRPKCIHFNGHTDIVPIGDPKTWSFPPLGGQVKDGIMYGRGVSDMKGGLAASVYAVEALKRAGIVVKGTIEQSFCVDEESTGVRNAGAGWLVEQGHVTPETVDGVVITEPLNVENVCLGHRGTIWGEITFHGIASHGATPQRGVNALVHAATFVVRATEEISSKLASVRDDRVIPVEAQGASLTFTVLQSGANTNSVPDLATLRYDRRLVPGETLSEARSQMTSLLSTLSSEIPELKFDHKELYYTEPVWVEEDVELALVWKDAVEGVLERQAGVVCSPGSDDQRFFVRGGIEQTIVYGPGNIRNVHNKDEALSLEDLRKSIAVMAIGICEFLGVE
ncbi:succinyl-diaminopimelate desuccinylase [Meredithblackwellia eburnea MCA 4105]